MARNEYSAKVDVWLMHAGCTVPLAQIGDSLVITSDSEHGLVCGDNCELYLSVSGNVSVEQVEVVQVDGKHVWLTTPSKT